MTDAVWRSIFYCLFWMAMGDAVVTSLFGVRSVLRWRRGESEKARGE